MAQQFDSPQTETQLREIQDKLYQHSKEVYDAGGRPAFKGLLEIMSAEATIVTAIHNIKSNHGSETPGVDSRLCVKIICNVPIRGLFGIFRAHLSILNRRKYAGSTSTNQERPKNVRWESLPYGTESCRNV